jgi:hypothetical protein
VTAPNDLTGVNARLITRLSTDYVLRTLQLIAEHHGGDLVRGIIALTIVAANTGHLTPRHDGTTAFPDMADLPPDEARRPISVLALSKSLGMPFETTRRHVNALIAAGFCRRVRGGVIVPAEIIASEANEAGIRANLANVRRFLHDLRRAGVE